MMLLCFEKWRYLYVNDFLRIQSSSHETVTQRLTSRLLGTRFRAGLGNVNYYL